MERIRKIPLEKLMDVLHELYNAGVDYVDISGNKVSETEDSISISYYTDYINPEYVEQYQKFEQELTKENESLSEDNIQVKFSDEDLDELI